VSDEEILQSMRETFRIRPDASPMEAVVEADADPDRWLDVAETLAEGGEPDAPPEAETDAQDDEHDAEPSPAEMPEYDDGAWTDVDWSTPFRDEYPNTLLIREQWMARDGKLPFAPWGDRDAPAECNTSDCPADRADEPRCDCDARRKWGYEEFYRDGETVAMAEADPKIDGRAYIQRDRDPFSFVDGDDVRDPETGAVHPAFVDILNRFGLTYADVSTSGSGVHANYEGELPNDIPEAKWVLDDEPWGSNDDLPAIEIYSNTHVCVTTGERLPGSAEDVREWDADAVRDVLDEAGELRQTTTDRADFDAEGYEPNATEADETTDKIRDIYHALDRLNAQRVAEDTVVAEWLEGRTDHRCFRPTWASPDYDGTAVYCDEDKFVDTGQRGGYGGPAAMAAIDAGLVSDTDCPRGVSGETWFNALAHLRDDLNYDIPEFVGEESSPTIPPSSADAEPDAETATDGGAAAAEGGDTQSDAEPEASTAEPSLGDSWQDIREMFREASDSDDRATPRFEAAMKLHREEYFANLKENEVLYAYDDDRGIYNSDGESVVREHLTVGLEEQYRSHTKNEVLEHIRGRNTLSKDDMGGPAWTIAAENCVIDLDAAEQREHSPDYQFMSRLGTEFDPDADAPRFREFLREVVPSESERRKLQEFAGYTLHHWGHPYHKALFLVGPTASGKSTFLDTINAMLGEGTTASLTPQQMTSERFAGAELFEKWANIRNDIPKATVENTGAFKEIVAGDPMKAEEKYQDPFRFEPTAKHLFAANQLPETEVDDEAFYRRILLVPFPETVPVDERDKHLDDKLQEELPGVLNWSIQGLQRLREQGGFTADRSPGHTADTWQKWGDSVSRFASDAVTEATDEHIPKSELYKAYLEYCRQESIPSDTQHSMTRGLKQEGFEDGRQYVDGNRKRCILNIDWTGRGRELLDAAKNRTSDDDRDSDPGRGSALKDF
jgi:P4 family phage/plasmid primase-like protien